MKVYGNLKNNYIKTYPESDRFYQCATNRVQEMKIATQIPNMNFARTSQTVNLKILATEYSFVLYKHFWIKVINYTQYI